jgi:hypothetical protein
MEAFQQQTGHQVLERSTAEGGIYRFLVRRSK